MGEERLTDRRVHELTSAKLFNSIINFAVATGSALSASSKVMKPLDSFFNFLSDVA